MTRQSFDPGAVVPLRHGGGLDVWRWARDPKLRGLLYQIALVGAIAILAYALSERALSGLAQRGVSSGFGFLGHEAGFQIAETIAIPRRGSWGTALIPAGLILFLWSVRGRGDGIGGRRSRRAALRLLAGALIAVGIVAAATAPDWATYQPTDSYLFAILTGVANTLHVAVIGCLLAAVFGAVFGLCQLSTNWLLRALSGGLTDLLRNVPLLLIVMFWYALLLNSFPSARSAVDIGGLLFLTNRGVYYPTISDFPAALWIPLAGIALGYIGLRIFAAGRAGLDRHLSPVIVTLALVGGALIVLIALAGWDVPKLHGFNFTGGGTVGPEFTALLIGLVLYHGSFIADIVRSGMLSVTSGQWEAGFSLGLPRWRIVAQIVLPQALRVILPPATLQFLGLTKNTSIGVVIGFPELVSVSRTVLNQTGKAIEVMLIVLVIYLVVSLAIAACVGAYQERIRIHER